MSVPVSLAVDHDGPGARVMLSRGADAITISEPAIVKIFGGEALRKGYGSVQSAEESIRAVAVLSLADGSIVRVVDVFAVVSEEAVSLHRGLEVVRAGDGRGLQVSVEAEARSPATGAGSGSTTYRALCTTVMTRTSTKWRTTWARTPRTSEMTRTACWRC
jgi:hypothetical protein